MAFTDLHEEIYEMFSVLEGQTTGLSAAGGFYTCRSAAEPSDELGRARKRRWQAEWRKNNPKLVRAAANRQVAKRAAERALKRAKKFGRPASYEGRAGTSTERVRRHRERKAAARGLH